MSQDKGVIKQFTDELDVGIFAIGVLVAALGVVAMATRPDQAYQLMDGINNYLWTNFAWAYLLLVFVLVLFVIFLVFGPWGRIKLGTPDEEPEFSFRKYFAMLYSAGIAAGIVFYGPAESIYHYATPSPYFPSVEASTQGAEAAAMIVTFFHWGVSAWTVYVVMALPIAYFVYRHGAPMRISTILTPWIGIDNLDSKKAKFLDVLAVLGTIGGVATTLGLVGSQFLTGLNYVFGVELGDLGTIAMITGLTIAFTLSVAAGVRRGISRVSDFNMVLFFTLMISVFILGPTSHILNLGAEAMGGYINTFVEMSLYTNISGTEPTWFVGAWTIFYWAWWMSWAPFVGLFIARISRGRTIRQVAFTGVFASTGITIPWFAALGGTSMFMQRTGAADILGAIDQYGGVAASGYPLFEALPFGSILTLMFLVLITTFFVTSADSSTLALAMLTTGGKQHPSTLNRVVWGGLMGAMASMLMVIGGVSAVQAAAIILGTPFGIVIVVGVASLVKTLRHQHPILVEPSEDSEPVPGTTPSAAPSDDD